MNFFTSPAFFLAIIFVAASVYTLYAKIRDSKAAPEEPVKEKTSPVSAKPVASAPNVSSGELELINTDEKTAAVIMALVSHNSGIPLNRLSFKSIRLMEDK